MIRYEFMDESIREADIHPETLFGKEQAFAREFLSAVKIPGGIENCCVCNAPRHEILFEKWGVAYAICPTTWTVSLARFPDEPILEAYFRSSDLARLRASRAYQDGVMEHRSDLWERQVTWMEGRINRYLGNDRYEVIDWGSKFAGWLDVLASAGFVGKLGVEDPLPPISDSTDHVAAADVVCLIDVLQRVRQPVPLLQKIARRIKPGGLLIAACRSGSGFDVLTLREASESIFPLDHIFLPSPRGLEKLLQQAGFDVLEVTTPGQFDMQYLRNAATAIPHDQYFQRYIIETGDRALLERMQGFLQRNNLSSHLRCVAKRSSAT